nr:hypothetical protein L203_06374 [Cryptococcus depauperatus CBS 7841]
MYESSKRWRVGYAQDGINRAYRQSYWDVILVCVVIAALCNVVFVMLRYRLKSPDGLRLVFDQMKWIHTSIPMSATFVSHLVGYNLTYSPPRRTSTATDGANVDVVRCISQVSNAGWLPIAIGRGMQGLWFFIKDLASYLCFSTYGISSYSRTPRHLTNSDQRSFATQARPKPSDF